MCCVHPCRSFVCRVGGYCESSEQSYCHRYTKTQTQRWRTRRGPIAAVGLLLPLSQVPGSHPPTPPRRTALRGVVFIGERRICARQGTRDSVFSRRVPAATPTPLVTPPASCRSGPAPNLCSNGREAGGCGEPAAYAAGLAGHLGITLSPALRRQCVLPGGQERTAMARGRFPKSVPAFSRAGLDRGRAAGSLVNHSITSSYAGRRQESSSAGREMQRAFTLQMRLLVFGALATPRQCADEPCSLLFLESERLSKQALVHMLHDCAADRL